MRRTTIVIIVTGLALTAPALTGHMPIAAQDNRNQSHAFGQAGRSKDHSMSAARMIGVSIENGQGETLGEVSDLILTAEGEATYAVIDVGGYLGMGARQIVVPYAELEFNGENRIFLETSQDKLKRRPELVYPENDSCVLETLQIHATGDDTKAEYERAMGKRISEWSQKMNEYSKSAKSNTQQVALAADESLNRACSNVETQWSELKQGSDEAWTDTQQSLEKAWKKI